MTFPRAGGGGAGDADGRLPDFDARIRVERADFSLDIAFHADAGQVIALLGPNGAGKTTVLRGLAGLLGLESGHIRLDGGPLHPLPAERRPIGMVFQDYRLFPHLSALDNVAFGLRCRGMRKAAARAEAARWLERVGLADRGRLRPRALSGGQAQRVALARALAVRPRLLLLDEPLAALDAHTRPEVRAHLRRHLGRFQGITVLVTHDPLDAMVLADRLVVIEAGRVVQAGEPGDVARHPRTDFVARLVGLNLYRGVADGHRVVLEDGVALMTHNESKGPVFLAFPPAALALYRSRPDGSPRNLWKATVSGIERHGAHIRVLLDGPLSAAADITPAALADLGLTPGCAVWAAVKATETRAYPNYPDASE